MVGELFSIKVTKSFTLPEERNSLLWEGYKKSRCCEAGFLCLELSHLDGNYGALVTLVA